MQTHSYIKHIHSCISLLLLLLSCTFISCGEDRYGEYEARVADKIWIEETMREHYLWYEDMPEESSVSYFLTINAFFKKLLKSSDKYSYVEELEETTRSSVYESGYGFEFTTVVSNVNSKQYYARILYVVPDSPADRAGLKRGDWISHKDNEAISSSNISILYDGEAAKLTLAKVKIEQLKEEDDEKDKDKDEDNNKDDDEENEEEDNNEEDNDEEEEEAEPVYTYTWETIEQTVEIAAAEPINTNPILTAEVIEKEGLKFGYLVYNSFNTGESYAVEDDPYIKDLTNTFSTKFKNQNLENFVLDLRYNPGGYLTRAQALASLLAPAEALGKPFCSLEYSDKMSHRNRTLDLSTTDIGNNNLNLNTLYVITSNNTASAAELVFYCLKPYMNIILIGETTEGKNVGSEPYSNNLYPYFILHPIVATIYDAKGETYTKGIAPDLEIEETNSKVIDTMRELFPLGDKEERLLSETIKIMENGGTIPTDEPEEENTSSSTKKFNSISRKAINSIKIK